MMGIMANGDEHSDPSERPTASILLTHEFCNVPPDFNFLETTLYQKIKPKDKNSAW